MTDDDRLVVRSPFVQSGSAILIPDPLDPDTVRMAVCMDASEEYVTAARAALIAHNAEMHRTSALIKAIKRIVDPQPTVITDKEKTDD